MRSGQSGKVILNWEDEKMEGKFVNYPAREDIPENIREQLIVELKQAKEKAEKFAHELKNANEQLREMAFRDGLTGLYNHRYFQDIMDRELSPGYKV